MMVFGSVARKNEALRTEIVWNALLRELRSTKTSGLLRTAQQTRKKRSRLDGPLGDSLSIAETCSQEKKVRYRRNDNSTMADSVFGSSATFLDLSPPSASLADVSFTFGRQHYTAISLPALAKSSCGCSSAGARKFDVFSSYRCPCDTNKSTRSSNNSNRSSSSTSSARVCDAF